MPLINQLLNADLVLVKIIQAIKPSVTQSQITDELSIHPDYPNLLALNDVLNNFGITSGAYRIMPDELADVPCPFIAHTKKTGYEFMLVKKLTNDAVTLLSSNKGDYTLSLNEFKQIFDGVVLVPDDVKTVKYINRSLKDNAAIWLAVCILALIFTSVLALNYSLLSYWQGVTLTFFKTTGLAVAILLLIQSIDKNNPLVQTLCGGGGKTNCNAILSSKAAKIFEGLSWSEVGFFYFSGTWLTLLISGGSLPILQLLAVLNICCLPYTIYSIYYQARIAKQWCLFCCAVQALLWLEFMPLVSILNQPLIWPSFQQILLVIIGLLVPVALWLLLKPILLQAQQLKPLKSQLQNFKYNTETFNATLKNQPKYAQPDDDWSIVLGNVEAPNIITMVSNPYCPPCAKTHNILDEWLSRNTGIQARIVFTADNNDKDIKTPVTRHLMALYQLGDKNLIQRALHDWYNQKQKNYDDWAKEYPVKLNEEDFKKLDSQKAWCQLAEVKATPTLLVNGYRLPDAYRLSDIKYMLE
ncbi:cysteine peptidase family C39 domain-containing protein [Mucilaginibacter litoreus]|uniref:Cysteine peptidase family C39 domain-containing protein n=1 Tax=Mucilaginibacter litoreus TaxID=1048221 RepID=A0ABW3ARD3_9SPHI